MSSKDVDSIKAKLNIVDVVGSYIKLERAGTYHKARCPFHNEKTPSFTVSDTRQTYHCFGCGEHGDIFTFVQHMDGLDFSGALKSLASRAGITLSREASNERDERAPLYKALEIAALYYERNLPAHTDVTNYLKNRGMTGATAKAFRIGYAQDQWRALHEHLKSKGCSDKVAEQAGLVIAKAGRYYDRFRGRIMFPITDSAGRVIAFTGRIYEEKNVNEKVSAKYVNSPETVLYNKSRVLYGFDLAKDSIRQTRSCVMVEGQMDCIMSYQAGVKNVVAVSGTALTEEHLAMIGRLAESIIFAFDADQAGQKAAARGIGMCIEQGFDVRIAEIPAGSDPADIVAKDPAGWRKCVDAAAPVLEHYISGIQDGQSAREARQYVQKSVLPLIARLSSHIEQARHINSIATRLGIREDAVWTDLEAIHEAEKSRKETGGSDAGVTHEKQVAGKRERIEGALVGLLEWQGRLNEKSSHTKQVLGRYEKLVGGQDMSLIKRLPQETIDMLAIRAEREYAEQADNLPEIIDELCVRLEKELLRDSRERLAHQADIARTQGLEEEENKFLDEVRTLTERIQKLDTEEGPPA